MPIKSIPSWAVCLPLAVSPIATQGATRDRVVLEPISAWNLDMAENKCRIARLFGSEESKTAFYLEQWAPSKTAYWAVAGPDVARFRSDRKASYMFGPGGQSEEFEFTKTTFGIYGNLVGADSKIVDDGRGEEADDEGDGRDWKADPRGLAHLDADRAEEITSLTLSQPGRSDVVVETGSMKPILAAMNACMEDLVEHWGLDPSEQRKVVSPPRATNLPSVVRYIQSTYPSGALRKGAQASFHLRIMVGVDGSIEDCALVNQTLAEDFDMKRHPCTAFQTRAEMEPARDAEGKPVRSFYTNRIVYRIG
ncbi:MAG: hypothetical protein R3E14_07345 [Erythrobacter sp.]